MKEASNLDEIILGNCTKKWFAKWGILPSAWRLPEAQERQILSASLRLTMIFSPASKLAVDDPINCRHLVVCDGMLMIEGTLSKDEFVATLLHEFGHIVNAPDDDDAYFPGYDEFWADDFARSCGYEDAILSSFERLKEIHPVSASNPDELARIERIRTQQPIKLRGQPRQDDQR